MDMHVVRSLIMLLKLLKTVRANVKQFGQQTRAQFATAINDRHFFIIFQRRRGICAMKFMHACVGCRCVLCLSQTGLFVNRNAMLEFVEPFCRAYIISHDKRKVMTHVIYCRNERVKMQSQFFAGDHLLKWKIYDKPAATAAVKTCYNIYYYIVTYII